MSQQQCLTAIRLELKWVIPENIHTIPQVPSWNSKVLGGGGFLDWNSEGKGDDAVSNFKYMGGGLSTKFPEGEESESFDNFSSQLELLVPFTENYVQNFLGAGKSAFFKVC